MATEQFVFDADYVARAFEQRGFGVTLGQTISGRRETGGYATTVVSIDRTGRLRMTRTFQSAPATTGAARFGRRRYQVIRDQSTTITVVIDLDDLTQLPGALIEMESLTAR